MSTLTSATVPFGEQRGIKIAALRGELGVEYSNLTLDDWAELIDQLVRDYKPYIKYLHPFTTMDARLKEFGPEVRLGAESYADRARITLVYEWQRQCAQPVRHIKSHLYVDQNGTFLYGVLTCRNEGSSTYELYWVSSMAVFLKHQSDIGDFSGLAFARDIVGGLSQMFDRSIKHKMQMIEHLQKGRDHINDALARIKY